MLSLFLAADLPTQIGLLGGSGGLAVSVGLFFRDVRRSSREATATIDAILAEVFADIDTRIEGCELDPTSVTGRWMGPK